MANFKWKNPARIAVNSGTIERSYVLDINNANDTTKAIVGFGFGVDDSNVVCLKVALMDLNTKTRSYHSQGDKVEWEIELNTDDYVVTGLGLNAGEEAMHSGFLYAQKIDDNAASQGYLSALVGRFNNNAVDKEETAYRPTNTNSQIIVGVEIGVRDGNIAALYLTQATLTKE